MDALACHRGGGGIHYTQVNAHTSRLTVLSDDLYYASASCSLCCSLFTLFLIKRTKKKTGYLGIIASLTFAQSIYDSSFLLYELFRYKGGLSAQRFVSFFGGLSSTLWTNVLSLLLVTIILRSRAVNVKRNYWKFFLAVGLPATSISIAAVVTDDLEEICAYNAVFWTSFSVRIASILFNIVCYLLIAAKMRPCYKSSTATSSSSSSSGGGSSITSATFAIRVLASRLKYYSLVQVLPHPNPNLKFYSLVQVLPHTLDTSP